MRISSVRIHNLCAAKDVTINCDNLTVLVGRNGTGKSTVLRALELFYSTSPDISAPDYYAEDTGEPIEIGVTFSDLTPEARTQFAGYLDRDSLSVVRVIALSGGKPVAKYHGETLQHPPFLEVRTMHGARELLAAYKEMRQQLQYKELPDARSKDAALEAFRSWEALHPDECQRMRDDGQFFGFSEVAQGYLGRYTRVIRIPAVRDASDDAKKVGARRSLNLWTWSFDTR